MIASDSSMLEVGKYLKMRGAGKVYLVATFALFTDGIDKFIDLYQKGCSINYTRQIYLMFPIQLKMKFAIRS